MCRGGDLIGIRIYLFGMGSVEALFLFIVANYVGG